MTSHVALLRGVNVGGNKGVPMSELKALAARLSLGNPRTVLQSGNLVFDCDGSSPADLESLLESETLRQLNVRTEYHVRTVSEWDAAVAANPFLKEAAEDPAHLVLMAFKTAPGPRALETLSAAWSGPERLHLKDREAYVVYPEGMGSSRLTQALLDRHLGRGTARNWNTVLKLAAMARA